MYDPTNPGYQGQNQTRFTPNYEPTVSDNPYASTPYDLQHIPTPPPPPKQQNKRLMMALVSILFLTTIFSGTLLVLMHINNQPEVSNPVNMASPTQVARQALSSTNFSTFIKAFATLLAEKDYAAVAAVTDTRNFQSVYLCSSGGIGTWNDMYGQLTTGNISFIINYPAITAEQEGYQGYTKQGSNFFTVHAADVQHVVGTAIMPNAPPNFEPTFQDETVFTFELPYSQQRKMWLWRAVTFSNRCL